VVKKWAGEVYGRRTNAEKWDVHGPVAFYTPRTLRVYTYRSVSRPDN